MTVAVEPPRDLTEITGSFGPWQLVTFIIFFYINIVGIWQNLSITFFAPNMDFECVSASFSTNLSSADSRCWTGTVGNLTPCSEWKYDKSVYSETIVSQWDLVCSREWLVSLTKSIYMIGFLLSVLIFGQISDWYGRFPTLVISYVIAIVSQVLSIFSTSYIMFTILRFFQALGRTALTTVGFILIFEMVGAKHRTEISIGIQIGWSVGFVSLALLAFLVRHWFWLQIALTIPLVPIFLTFPMIPESPRWLLMKGKLEKLMKALKVATQKNKKELKYEIKDFEILQKRLTADNPKTSTILDLLKTSQMRNKYLNMVYIWIVNSFMYYGLSFNTNEMAGDPYLNFFLAGLMEFPAYALLFVLILRFGRRTALVGLMLAGGSACALAILPVSPGVRTGLAMAGKFCVTASFGLLYLYTSELFPTVVRNVALGSCSCAARIGSILAPFVRELGKYTYLWVPDVLYAVLAVSSGLLALLLPETQNKSLPDSLYQDETESSSQNTTTSTT